MLSAVTEGWLHLPFLSDLYAVLGSLSQQVPFEALWPPQSSSHLLFSLGLGLPYTGLPSSSSSPGAQMSGLMVIFL